MSSGGTHYREYNGENFDNVVNVNLRGMVMTCKHVSPIMRNKAALASISSMAAIESYLVVTSNQALLQ